METLSFAFPIVGASAGLSQQADRLGEEEILRQQTAYQEYIQSIGSAITGALSNPNGDFSMYKKSDAIEYERKLFRLINDCAPHTKAPIYKYSFEKPTVPFSPEYVMAYNSMNTFRQRLGTGGVNDISARKWNIAVKWLNEVRVSLSLTVSID
jgi:hypothetical protein